MTPDETERAAARNLDASRQVPTEAFDQHRSLLPSIAYRMLGSLADAEDMVQETFIRWQQASSGVAIHSPRAFLVTIISRLCINHLQSARVRRVRSTRWAGLLLVLSYFGGAIAAHLANHPFIAGGPFLAFNASSS
jgi:DNA-directed RNA polymerase specialized sigma24 family protein